jgi:hypothetical protein
MGKTQGDVKSRNPSFGPELEKVGFPVVVLSFNEAKLPVIQLHPRRWQYTGAIRNK